MILLYKPILTRLILPRSYEILELNIISQKIFLEDLPRPYQDFTKTIQDVTKI